jgi:ATP-binding cassette subfamily C protein
MLLDWAALLDWLGANIHLYAPAALLLLLGVVLLLFARGRRLRRPAASLGDGARRASPEGGVRLAPAGAGNAAISEPRAALSACRGAFVAIAAFSALINVLMLTGAVFMLEVYDRVLPSRSVATLVALCIVACILYAALGLLDLIRGRLLARAGGIVDEILAERVFDLVVRLPVRAGMRAEGLQPSQDLDSIRGFLSGAGPTAIFDLPWLPLYLAVVYFFHPTLGLVAVIGAVLLIALTLLTEVMGRRPMRDVTTLTMGRNNVAQACVRNAEVLAGMGFASRLYDLWRRRHDEALTSHRRGSDIASGLGAIARVLRMVLQSAVLAVGAVLVIAEQASAGIIIAGSILVARALAPVDVAIANWRGFIAARQSWQRLGHLLGRLPPHPKLMPLPAPTGKLQVENLVVVPPGEQKATIRDISFTLNAGQGLGIIGASGAGKSSLVRALVGAWLPAAGKVRLDGAALEQWAVEALGQHIGYLPQDVELFAGSVAQNIARFDPAIDPDAVIKAAMAADVHDLIVNLPNGYDTEIGVSGATLSAGQRQRVALARALYGDPFVVVLDEPDASLDREGEQALQKAILGVRERGGIAVVVSHRQTVLNAVDLLMALERGRPLVAGPKELVLQRLARPAVHNMK